MGHPKKIGDQLTVLLVVRQGKIGCFPHGYSADHTLCPHTTHLYNHSKPSWLWSALRKQVSNLSFCLIFFLSHRVQCCDYQLQPKAACRSILRIWNNFILWPWVSAQAHLVYSRFVYMDRWPAVHNQNSFYPLALLFLTSGYISSSTCGVCPQTSFHFPMSESDRALRSSWRQSLSSLKQAQALTQLFPVCQARLLPWPLENSLVMEHFPFIGITSHLNYDA